MPAPRQQRSRVSRRAVTLTQPATPQDELLGFTQAYDAIVEFAKSPGQAPMIITGIPDFRHNQSPRAIISFVELVTIFRLTFSADIVFPLELTLLQGDLAARTPWGGFLPAIYEIVNGPPQPPVTNPTSAWNPGAATGGDLSIAFAGGNVYMSTQGVGQWVNDTTGQAASNASTSGNVATVQWPTPPASGDQISFADPATSVWIDDGTIPEPGPHTVT